MTEKLYVVESRHLAHSVPVYFVHHTVQLGGVLGKSQQMFFLLIYHVFATLALGVVSTAAIANHFFSIESITITILNKETTSNFFIPLRGEPPLYMLKRGTQGIGDPQIVRACNASNLDSKLASISVEETNPVQVLFTSSVSISNGTEVFGLVEE
jgi:hypothetical protein